jgi:hypothetical protein
MGEYVYAYYRPEEYVPFYVGKGVGVRVLAHWKGALERRPKRLHEKEIQAILKKGRIPDIRLLAYELERSSERRNALGERILQDAFGIQDVLKKRLGGERLERHPGALRQKREDSATSPMLSLEAVVARAEVCGRITRDDLNRESGLPILVVGLSKSYDPRYSASDLAEMARMYWSLENVRHTSLPRLLKGPALLLGWASKLNGRPMVVGAWRIVGPRRFHREAKRYEFQVKWDPEARRQFLGKRLYGSGKAWQGPKILGGEKG